MSVLAIPLEKNELTQLVLDGWEYFSDAESADEVKVIVKTLTKASSLPGIDKWDHRDIWAAVQDRKVGKSASVSSVGDIKAPEWEVLTSPTPPKDWPHFLSTSQPPPSEFRDLIDRVLLLERLREVNALLGYTRVDAPEESSNPDERPTMAALCRGRAEWVPASEVHGEGVFIQLNEAVVANWELQKGVGVRDAKLDRGHQGWRNARHLDPTVGNPGIRFAMLHTLAHLLIRELALECGYNAASIRERVYASSEGDRPMAGVLLYTAAADSDGTLGGLVELGKPENLGRLIGQALERARVCSSDPLCAEHDPRSEERRVGKECW